MLQKNEKSGTISFLFGEKKADKVEEKVAEVKEERPLSKAHKLNNSDAINSRMPGQVLSAGQGNISDNGGPKKYMGCQTNNSIWNHEVLSKLSETPGSDEKSKDIQSNVKKLRNSMDQDRLDAMAESLKETDMRKDATVQNVGEYEERGTQYKRPQNNLSIFDTSFDFERVPKQTDGEKSAKEARKESEKDDSWKKISKAKTTKNALDSLFESLNGKK